jgi:hypothetical protein
MNFTTHVIPAEEVAETVDAFIALHRNQWASRGIAAEHIKPEFAAHLRQALEAMVDRGEAAVTEYHLDDEVVAVDILVIGRNYIGTYLFGHAPKLRSEISVFTLILHEGMGLAQNLSKETYSMLRGLEAYKDHWKPSYVPNTRLILTGGLLGSAYVALLAARSWVESLLATEKKH